MVGIPTSRRCDLCRKRKAKCDETWPACGTCRRARKPCSGPPATTVRFMPDHNHGSSGDLTVARLGGTDSVGPEPAHDTAACLPQKDQVPLVWLRTRMAKDGNGTYSKLRFRGGLCPSPATPPQNAPDSLIGHLVHVLESGLMSLPSIRPKLPWLPLTAPRLAPEPVLCDAISLLLSTWSNTQKGLPPLEVVDPMAYGKSLKSLRTALQDPVKAYETSTLAAISLVQAVEDCHNTTKQPNQDTHAAGMCALMVARGPPRGEDELDIRLCFENICSLLTQFLFAREQNFFGQPEWLEAMKQALQGPTITAESQRNLYRLYVLMAEWPDLAMELRELISNPTPSEATDFLLFTTQLADTLEAFAAEVIEPLMKDDSILVVSDSTKDCSWSWGFVDWQTCEIFFTHAMISIAVHRILIATMGLFDFPVDERLHKQILTWSERIWRTVPYVENLDKGADRDEFIGPLVLAFEAADLAMRSHIAGKMVELAKPRFDYFMQPLEEVILGFCNSLTGR